MANEGMAVDGDEDGDEAESLATVRTLPLDGCVRLCHPT